MGEGAGYQNGLSISLRNNYDDYFLTTLSTNGYMVHIFYPEDFPDKLSGSLSENIVSFGTEVMIILDVQVTDPTKNLMSSSVNIVSNRNKNPLLDQKLRKKYLEFPINNSLIKFSFSYQFNYFSLKTAGSPQRFSPLRIG